MRIMGSFVRAGFLAAVGSILLGGPLGGLRARGQVLADKLPANALAYAGWAGSDAIGPAYEKSHLKGFVDALGLRAYLRSQLRGHLAQVPAEQAGDAALLEQWLTAIGKSPTALYVGGVDLPGVTLAADAQPVPHLALLSKVGQATAEALAEKIDALMHRDAGAGGAGEPVHRVVSVGDYLLFYIGDDAMVGRLKGAGGAGAAGETLAESEAFKNAIAAAGGGAESAVAVYVDAQGMAQLLAQAAQHANDVQVSDMFPAIAQGAGLTGLKQAAWAGKFDGSDWKGGGFVGMGEARHGVLAFFDNPPLTDASLKLIPATATSAGAFRFDGMRLLADVKATAAAIDPGMPAQLDTVLKQAYAWTGVDFTKELLPALGDEFVYYGTPSGTGNSLLGFTVVNRLKDAKLGESALSAAENFTNLLILQRDPNSKLQFAEQDLPAPLEKIKAHVMTTEAVQPAWAIMDGTLFVSLSVQGLENALEMGRTSAADYNGPKKPTILENARFAGAWKKLGGEKFSSFTFADLAKSAPESYQLLARALARAKAENPNPADFFALPPLDRLMPELGPTLSIYWSDKQGLHERDTGPFPLSGYLAPTSFLSLRVAELIQAQRGARGGAGGAGAGGAGALP